MKVIVVTVTYGNRFLYLKQLIDSLVEDEYVSKIIIVDNGSYNYDEIKKEEDRHKEKIQVIRLEKNAGSAVGFARGLEQAQKEEGTHVFLLDDDNVPEVGALKMFKDTLTDLGENKNIVLCGNRNNLVGSDRYFFERIDVDPLFTFFDILNLKKIKSFFQTDTELSHISHKDRVAVDSFAYGGTLLPIDSVKRAPLPDESLVLYGDDTEYSWNIKKLGLTIYACSTPKISDVDLTFGQDTHITGLFDEKTKSFKVFYRIRNMVYLSIKHSRQPKVMLYLNMAVWMTGLLLIGAWKKKINKTYFRRVRLITLAIYAGFYPQKPIPEGVSLP